MAKRKASYNITFKLKAVKFAEEHSKEGSARHFNVDTKRIREWCKQKDSFTEQKKKGNSSRKRLTGAGRKVDDVEMEEELFDWIVEMRGQNLRISLRMIQIRAKELSSSDCFKASRGWLYRFLKRKNLSLRRRTTLAQSTPADCIPKLVNFVLHLRHLMIKSSFSEQNIIAMDETACWMDMPSDTTVTFSGSRSVPLKTTGNEKNHFTVVLSARASGMKLKPFIVFKGKGTRLIKALEKIPGIVVRFSANGWMNDALTVDYLQSIVGALSFGQRLLVWDSYKCHISSTVKAEVSRLRLKTAIVPGGCTKCIQAPDVVWNAAFKSKVRSRYDPWMADSAGHQFTRGGSLKAPSRVLLCEWIKSSWAEISCETIKASFKSCGITTATSGAEDNLIHCFKEGQPCADGKSMLDEKSHQLLQRLQDGDIDPFAEEDEEEAESNEVRIDEDLDEDSETTSSDNDSSE